MFIKQIANGKKYVTYNQVKNFKWVKTVCWAGFR